MKTRVFPSILVAASVFSLYSTPPVDWERVGENWGNSRQEGVKRLSGKIVTDSLRLYGHVQLDEVTIKRYFTCYGYAQLKKVNILGVTTMYGPMVAENSTFTDVDVRCHNKTIGKGIVKLNNCTLNKLALNGRLEAHKSTIKQITTFATKTVLSNSKVHDIKIVNTMPTRHEKATLILDNTTIKGSITFTQKGGIIICKGTSKIHGTIINGTIIKQ